ncbi:LIC12162 family protein [Flavobacteriaceae bacterium]|nr:LIC12162 family protein [Flavobacteriaceae bacterium]
MFKKQKLIEKPLVLVLGCIPKDFNYETHIVISLSSFSGSGIDPEFVDFRRNTFCKGELLKESLRSVKYYNYLSDKLGEKLNSEYNLNLSEHFWSIFFNSWLTVLIQICLKREKSVLNIIDKYKDQEISVVISNKKQNWKFSDSLDFLNNGVVNPEFNEWLNSRILEHQIPLKWKVSYKKIEQSKKKKILNKNKNKNKNKIKIKTFLNRIISFLTSRCSSIYGFNVLDKFYFSFLLIFKSKISRKENVEVLKENINWSFNFIDDIINKLDFEYFNKLPSVKINKNKGGKLKLISAEDLFYDSDKIIDCAKRVEGGEYLIGTQHGGHTYGSALITDFLNSIELNKCLQFFTWGWNNIGGSTTSLQPLSSPYLEGYKNKHIRKNEKIILVGTRMHLFFRRFESAPQPQQWLAYREQKTKLISKIIDIENCKDDFFYRPYFNEIGSLKETSFLKNKFPDLSFIKGDLHKEIFSCRLLILDHPGTTLNIAMAGNIPVLCIWHEESFHFNEYASESLANLKKNNIFFSDVDELIIHLNNIEDNVSDWWQSTEIQTTRIEWCNTYARTSNHWRKEWTNQLINIK